MAYLGNTPTQQAFTPAIDYFSGDGAAVAFTLSRPVAAVAQVKVVIENVPQNPGSAFTVSGNTITFTSAPPAGTNNIYVYYTSPVTQVIQPGQGTVDTAQLVNSSVTGAKLELSGVTAGTYGSASAIPAITVDAKGRVTSVTTNAVSGGVTSVDSATGAVTLSSLSTFAKSLGSNGYQKLPGGLILQWGVGTSTQSGNYNAFPISFPNSCFMVCGSPNDTPSTGVYACIYSPSASGFYVVNNAGGTRTYWWIATGY